MTPLNARVSVLGEPLLVQLLDGTEEGDTAPLTDRCAEYGEVQTGEVELPPPAFAPRPCVNRPDCKREAGNGHR